MGLEVQMQNNKPALDLIETLADLSKLLLKTVRIGISGYNSSSRSLEILSCIDSLNEKINNLVGELPRPTIIYMTDIVTDWFNNSSERDKEEFVTTEFERLPVFMNSIGMNIINHFKLWAYPWESNIEDGIDNSPDHPEAIALEVIENVWRNVKND